MIFFTAYEIVHDAIFAPTRLATADPWMLGGVIVWFNFPLDRVAALVIVVAIGKTGWDLLSDGMRVLLDASLDADTLLRIREIIAQDIRADNVGRHQVGRELAAHPFYAGRGCPSPPPSEQFPCFVSYPMYASVSRMVRLAAPFAGSRLATTAMIVTMPNQSSVAIPEKA